MAPGKRYELLEPWLRLANLVRPYLLRGEISQVTNEQFVAEFRTAFADEIEKIDQLWRDFGVSSLSPIPDLVFMLDLHTASCALRGLQVDDPEWRDDPGPAWVFGVAHDAAAIFDSLCARESRTGAQAIPVYFQPGSDGRVMIDFRSSRTLVAAIDGAEIQRFGRCEVCGNFLFARRLGEPGCSERCDRVRRVRAWRTRERKRAFRASQLKSRGKDLSAIAKTLGVTTQKARGYITRVPKE